MAIDTEELVPQARAGTDHAVVVTSDGHCGPQPEQLREYCPKAHLDEFDAFFDAQRTRFAMMPKDERGRDEIMKTPQRNTLTDGGWDPYARLRDMDFDGVAGEVIFHGLNQGRGVFPLPWGDLIGTGADPTTPPELVGLGRHIYNQWLADFCSVEHERRAGLCQLPMWDIEASVRELQWAAEAGLRGVNFPRVQAGIPPYNDLAWEPFWSACEDLVMPLSTHAHGIPTGPSQEMLNPELPGSGIIGTLDLIGQSARIAMHYLIFGGVFDRHPNLHLVFTEQPGTWWDWTMHELDSMVIGLSTFNGPSAHTLSKLPKLPSEYCADQLFIGATCLAEFEAKAAVAGGYQTQVLFGTDYPHPEGSFQLPQHDDEYPMTKLSLRDALHDVDRESAALMAGENAARIYGLDIDDLRGVAARIDAITFDELNEPVATEELDPPYVRGAFYSFRRHSGWH
jgi:predicted TIM-barrel fold metal-dependent hydrolase